MRLLLGGLTVFALVGTAGAEPWDRTPPPGMLRGDIQVRVGIDGRADMRMERFARPELPRMERPSRDEAAPRIERERNLPLPIRTDVILRARPGDGRDSDDPKLDRHKTVSQPAAERDTRPQLLPSTPPIPLKRDILIKVGMAARGEGGNPIAAAVQRGGIHNSNVTDDNDDPKHARKHDKDMLCKQGVICLPRGERTLDSDEK